MKGLNMMENYLAALHRAEVKVTDAPRRPLLFNHCPSRMHYHRFLLHAEVPLFGLLLEMNCRERRLEQLSRAVQGWILELKGVFLREGDHLSHRHLRVCHNGEEIPPARLSPTLRELLDQFLELQRDSFRRVSGWLAGSPVPPLPATIGRSDMDVAEVLALHLYTSFARMDCEDFHKSSFIRHFCHAWGLKEDKDYSSLISHALSRPHPTAFLEKTLEELKSYIETKDRHRV